MAGRARPARAACCVDPRCRLAAARRRAPRAHSAGLDPHGPIRPRRERAAKLIRSHAAGRGRGAIQGRDIQGRDLTVEPATIPRAGTSRTALGAGRARYRTASSRESSGTGRLACGLGAVNPPGCGREAAPERIARSRPRFARLVRARLGRASPYRARGRPRTACRRRLRPNCQALRQAVSVAMRAGSSRGAQ